MTGVMVGGLGAFCLLFAINSSIHSYLIVRYADGDKVAMNIGFYYCANALGRLTGLLRDTVHCNHYSVLVSAANICSASSF